MILAGIMPWTWGIPWWGWLIITLVILGAGGAERTETAKQRQAVLDLQIEDELNVYQPAVVSLKAGFIIGLMSWLLLEAIGWYAYTHHHHGWGWTAMILGGMSFWSGLSMAVPQGTFPGDYADEDELDITI